MSEELVNADRIDKAPLKQGVGRSTQTVVDPLTRDPIIDQKMGMLGKLFGYGDEKKGNLASFSFFLTFGLLTVCVIAPMVSNDPKVVETTGGMVTPLFGILAGIIGYVTGHKSES